MEPIGNRTAEFTPEGMSGKVVIAKITYDQRFEYMERMAELESEKVEGVRNCKAVRKMWAECKPLIKSIELIAADGSEIKSIEDLETDAHEAVTEICQFITNGGKKDAAGKAEPKLD